MHDIPGTSLRLFIGIHCGGLIALNQALDELAESRPDPSFKVTPHGNLHITLKFLGAVPPSRLPGITAGMTRIAAQSAPLALSLSGAGNFSTALWAGIQANGALNQLAAALDREMASLGFESDGKSYTPHITLARLKRGHREFAAAWCERHAETNWGALEVPQISLFRSDSIAHDAQSHQTAVRYSIINSVTLRG